MSRKKQEALSTTLNTSSEFQDFISAPNKLNIIDAHPKWTGPCKSVTTFFKRLKLEVSNPKLRFGVACIEDIEHLEPYVDTKPEPLFLYYASGVLVARVRGCDGPLLTKVTNEMLAKEDLIENGEASRVEISHDEEEATAASGSRGSSAKSGSASGSNDAGNDANGNATDSPSTINANSKQLTFAIITPAYIDSSEKILSELSTQGIECLKNQQIHLTNENLRSIIPNLEDRDGWEAFTEYMTSKTSVCLVLTRVGELGVGVISQMNLLAGPSDQDQAKIESPESVNANYGSMALYTSSNGAEANNAISLMFPDFTPPLKSSGSNLSNNSNSNSDNQKSSNDLLSNQFSVKTGDNNLVNDEMVGKLTNFGVSVVSKNDEENVVVLSCKRSIGNLKEIIGGINEGFEVSAE